MFQSNGVQAVTNGVTNLDVMEGGQTNSKIHLALIFGGESAEHEVSLRSSMTVIKVINRQKYDLTLIGVNKQGQWTLCEEDNYLVNSDDPARIALAPSNRYLALIPGCLDTQFIDTTTGQKLKRIDLAFSLLHGALGEDGSVQGLLQVLKIPFVGSHVLGSAACMDKEIAKRVMRDAGLPVTPWVTLLRSSTKKPDFNAIVAELGLPLFVKPAGLGSSIGVSKVEDEIGFQKAVAFAFSFDHKVLVETAINAREIEVAVLGNENLELSSCGEIDSQEEFYTYDSKYFVNGTGAGLIVPANIPPGVSEEIKRIAKEAFTVLGCGILSRVDCFLSKEGQILVNEINTLPGFTPSSVYPMLWEANGCDRAQLVEKLLLLTLERAKKAKEIKTDR